MSEVPAFTKEGQLYGPITPEEARHRGVVLRLVSQDNIPTATIAPYASYQVI